MATLAGGNSGWNAVGGWPALDFINTVELVGEQVDVEYLHSYADLAAWAAQAAGLDAEPLQAAAQASPLAASLAFREALRLRGSLFALFRALARGETPPAEALDALNAAVTAAQEARVLRVQSGAGVWVWRDPAALRLPVWLAALSAAELLSSPRLARLRQCEADDCSWLFLDTTKNHSRRWCDMADCGNRAKARRHYERVKTRR